MVVSLMPICLVLRGSYGYVQEYERISELKVSMNFGKFIKEKTLLLNVSGTHTTI